MKKQTKAAGRKKTALVQEKDLAWVKGASGWIIWTDGDPDPNPDPNNPGGGS